MTQNEFRKIDNNYDLLADFSFVKGYKSSTTNKKKNLSHLFVNSKYNLIPTVLESLAIMGRNGVDSAENFLVNKFFSKEFFKGLKYKYFTQEMIDRQKNIPYEELALKNFYYQLKSKISEKAFIAIHLKLKALLDFEWVSNRNR